MTLFNRKSLLDARIKKVKKELNMLDGDLRSLADVIERPGRTVSLPRLKSSRSGLPEKKNAHIPEGRANKEDTEKKQKSVFGIHAKGKSADKDERFLDYLSTSFNTGRPMRHERRLQRNKAIFMLIFVVLLLIWIIYELRM